MNEQRFPAGWDEQRVRRLLGSVDVVSGSEADEAKDQVKQPEKCWLMFGIWWPTRRPTVPS